MLGKWQEFLPKYKLLYNEIKLKYFITVCRFMKQFVFIFSTKYFPNRVISSHASFDLSQKPKSEMWEMTGGPRRSKEQSLPAYPSWQVQLPNYDNNNNNNNNQKFALNLKHAMLQNTSWCICI